MLHLRRVRAIDYFGAGLHQHRSALQRRKRFYCSVPPPGKCGRNRGISAEQRDQRQATILETYLPLRDDLLHLLAQLAHRIISIDVSKQLHEANPVMRGKGLVGTRVELAGDLINEIGKDRHESERCSSS